MALLWDMLGRAASVMQLAGVDAFGMVSMIRQAARTARRNRDLCEHLATKVEIVKGLLNNLHIPELRRHRETRQPLFELRAALFRGYILVWSCTQPQSRSRQFLQMLGADDMAAMLQQAKDDIDSYISLIPVVFVVASVKAQGSQEVHDEVTNYAAPTPVQRSQLSIQEVTDSSSLENELQQSTHQIISPNEEPTQIPTSQFNLALPSNWTQEHLSELVSMMVYSAETASHSRDQCQQLAHRIAGTLIQRPLGTQRQLEQLEGILFRAYMLIDICRKYSSSQIHQIFRGADMQPVFGLAQEEIGRQIYRLTSRVPAQEVQDDRTNNPAQAQSWTPLRQFEELPELVDEDNPLAKPIVHIQEVQDDRTNNPAQAQSWTPFPPTNDEDNALANPMIPTNDEDNWEFLLFDYARQQWKENRPEWMSNVDRSW